MSEYQYYEFQAIDRPLGEADRAELQALSSRARVTSTSFTNTYNGCGSQTEHFRGAWVCKCRGAVWHRPTRRTHRYHFPDKMSYHRRKFSITC